MSNRFSRAAVAGACGVLLFVLTVPVWAHHSFASEYDADMPSKLQGTVKKVEWMNPHIYTHIEAKDASGKTVVYEVEGGAPNALFRNGWRADTLKAGETVNVTGTRAKSDSSMRVGQATITKADGTRVFGGAAAANQ